MQNCGLRVVVMLAMPMCDSLVSLKPHPKDTGEWPGTRLQILGKGKKDSETSHTMAPWKALKGKPSTGIWRSSRGRYGCAKQLAVFGVAPKGQVRYPPRAVGRWARVPSFPAVAVESKTRACESRRRQAFGFAGRHNTPPVILPMAQLSEIYEHCQIIYK